MEFNSEILFLFSALGFINGIILGMYFLFFIKAKSISNAFLGAMLIALSIRVGKSMIVYYPNIFSAFILQLVIVSSFLIGPLLFFYVKSTLANEKGEQFRWKFHLSSLIAVITTISIKFPYIQNLGLWQEYLMKIVLIQWAFYSFAAGYQLRLNWKESGKHNDFSRKEIWLIGLVGFNLCLSPFYFSPRFSGYLLAAVTFIFVTYLIFFFLNHNHFSEVFGNAFRNAKKSFDSKKVNQLIDRLEQLMEEEKLFKQANLKSERVAEELGISRHQFSHLINEVLGKNFTSLINNYRVEHAKKLLKSNHNFTIEGIGQECGFTSKSTFYSAFKKNTGTTPKKFV